MKLARLSTGPKALRSGPRTVPTPSEQRLRGSAGQARRWRLWQANPYCATCGRLLDWPRGFEADHIVGLAEGGEDKDRNLQLLCVWWETDGSKQGCHELKTQADRARVGR